MRTNLRDLAIICLGILATGAALAQGAGEAEALRKRLADAAPELKGGDVAPSPIPGLFEFRLGPQVAYVSADGRYLVRGDIIEIKTDANLTEARRSTARLAAIEEVGEGRMLVFAPKQVKHTINVFTDIDCGYCRRLHKEMDQYLAQGIRVRYLFFPRSGPNTESWSKAETVWCSADRNAALTRSKRGEVVAAKACSPTPVQQHYSLGLSLGVQGTPAIITDTGELLPGYVPPDELAQYLNGGKTS